MRYSMYGEVISMKLPGKAAILVDLVDLVDRVDVVDVVDVVDRVDSVYSSLPDDEPRIEPPKAGLSWERWERDHLATSRGVAFFTRVMNSAR